MGVLRYDTDDFAAPGQRILGHLFSPDAQEQGRGDFLYCPLVHDSEVILRRTRRSGKGEGGRPQVDEKGQ